MKSESSQSFTGKVALITGGTAGIGRATAIAFAGQGAHVVIAGRREAEGAESVGLVEAAGGKGLFVRADVSREEDHVALVARTLEHFGRLDFAFNNAGVVQELGPLTETSAEVFNRTMSINVGGVFFGMKHQIPALLRSGGGVIVNNSSVLGLRPFAGSAVYNATKFAIIGLTKTAALEFADKGVRVNAVCPGVIETDMTAGFRADAQVHSVLLSKHPIGRFGRSEEVAAAVLYLCSPGAAFTTGIALPVDGGFTV